jgi:fermentation-respiration switch protein FrsA (DUF1100 family)
MINVSKIDYSTLDRPEILLRLFHPRPEPQVSRYTAPITDTLIPPQKDFLISVEEQVVVGARFHMTEKSACNILFFHGNGEIVADYDDLGARYNQMGINFLAADYRGYGRSSGKPTVTGMMRDGHIIFDFVKNWLLQNNYPGPIVLMGRSLGSASALELASTYKDGVDGLIVESGFAYAGPLLELLGANPEKLGFKEELGFGNIDKMKRFDKAVLIIHAELDHIIPFSDGQALYDACLSRNKSLLKIPEANHNDIFMRGLTEYLAAVKKLADSVK